MSLFVSHFAAKGLLEIKIWIEIAWKVNTGGGCQKLKPFTKDLPFALPMICCSYILEIWPLNRGLLFPVPWKKYIQKIQEKSTYCAYDMLLLLENWPLNTISLYELKVLQHPLSNPTKIHWEIKFCSFLTFLLCSDMQGEDSTIFFVEIL